MNFNQLYNQLSFRGINFASLNSVAVRSTEIVKIVLKLGQAHHFKLNRALTSAPSLLRAVGTPRDTLIACPLARRYEYK